MDKLILGLLIFGGQTMYEMHSFIQKNLKMMCSDSIGSIQAALKKLIQAECIVFVEKFDNGKTKKVYSITDKGRQVFLDWVQQPMRYGKTKSMELSHLFFMGLVQAEKRIALIDSYLADLYYEKKNLQEIEQNTRLAILAMYEKNGKNHEQNDVLMFEYATLEYGMQNNLFEIDFYEKLKKRMMTNEVFPNN